MIFSKTLTLATNTIVICGVSVAVVAIALEKIDADQLLVVSAICGLLSLTSLNLSKQALPKPEVPETGNAGTK